MRLDWIRRAREGPCTPLYVLDEPTVGLHMADVGKARGASCIVWSIPAIPSSSSNTISTSLAEADWIVGTWAPKAGDGRRQHRRAGLLPETIVRQAGQESYGHESWGGFLNEARSLLEGLPTLELPSANVCAYYAHHGVFS